MTYIAHVKAAEDAAANLKRNDEVLAYGHQMTNGRGGRGLVAWVVRLQTSRCGWSATQPPPIVGYTGFNPFQPI